MVLCRLGLDSNIMLKLSFLILLVVTVCLFENDSAAQATNSEPNHIIIAFDTSCHMANCDKSRDRRFSRDMSRMKKCLMEILYQGLPTKLSPHDQILDPPQSSPKVQGPLYRKGSSLTFFTFSAEPKYFFAGKQEFVPQSVLENILPGKFTGPWGSTACAEIEALQNIKPKDGSTYLVLVTSQNPSPSPDPDRHEECKARLSSVWKDKGSNLVFGMNVADRYQLRIFSIHDADQAYPFLLSMNDKTFIPDSLDLVPAEKDRFAIADFSIVPNPKLNRDYKISKLTIIARLKNKEKVVEEITVANKPPIQVFPVGVSSIPASVVNNNHVLDLEIEYLLPNAVDSKGQPKTDYFVIWNVGINTDAPQLKQVDQPQPVDSKPDLSIDTSKATAEEQKGLAPETISPFVLNTSKIQLHQKDGDFQSEGLELKTRPETPADQIEIKEIVFEKDSTSISVPLSPRTATGIPVNLVLPVKDFQDAKLIDGKLIVGFQQKNTPKLDRQELGISLELIPNIMGPKISLLGSEEISNQLSFLISNDESLLSTFTLNSDQPIPAESKIVAELQTQVGNIPINITPKDLNTPQQIKLSPGQWADFSFAGIKEAILFFSYTLGEEQKSESIPVNLNIPPKPLGNVEFVTSLDQNEIKPMNELKGRWLDSGLQIDNFYLHAKTNSSDLWNVIENISFRSAGLLSKEEKIDALPLKLQFLVKTEEAGKIVVGKQALDLIIDYKIKGQPELKSKTIQLVVDVPKMPDPQFVIGQRGNPNPVSEMSVSKVDGKIVIPSLELRTKKHYGLQSIEKIQLVTEGKTPIYEWSKAAVKNGELRKAEIDELKFPAGSGEVPVNFKVFFTQTGREGQGSANTSSVRLLIPCGWPYPLSELEGILPCIPLPVLIALLALFPLLILVIALLTFAKSKPLYITFAAVNSSHGEDNQVSELYELKRGEKLAFGPGSSAKIWDIGCPDSFVEVKKAGFLGKNGLYLGDASRLSTTQMNHGHEYPVTCSDGTEMRIKPHIFTKKPKNPPEPKQPTSKDQGSQGDKSDKSKEAQDQDFELV